MPDVKAIAFYLPQYHPIPENDLWWGKGFTEWVTVARARPLFPSHHQPRLPADLGFYDLRVPEVRAEQANLARRYGLYGFCYYHYWFNGRRLLERPLDEVLKSGQPDFPFCICWANENWTRRWDGAEHEILMQQEHSPESDRKFIEDVIPILRDPRYIRIRGDPLLLVYRAPILPDPSGTTAIWRAAARRAGIGEIHLAAMQSFGLGDPTPMGFDSGVEFPPHVELPAPCADRVRGLDPRFRGYIYDYREVAGRALAKPIPGYSRFRGVMTSWDNTPRRGFRSHIFLNASPEEYERWLRAVVEQTRATRDREERFLFINAWNEWAEGAHLEPDQRCGHAYLEATARALGHPFERQTAPSLHWDPEDRLAPPGGEAGTPAEVSAFQATVPEALRALRLDKGGRMHLDQAQGTAAGRRVLLRRGTRVGLAGWAFAPNIEAAHPDTSAFFVLRSLFPARTYYAPLRQRLRRDDVVHHLSSFDPRFTANAGFEETVSLDAVARGRYRLGIVTSAASRASIAFCRTRVFVD